MESQFKCQLIAIGNKKNRKNITQLLKDVVHLLNKSPISKKVFKPSVIIEENAF